MRKGFLYFNFLFNWFFEKGVLFENKEDFSLKRFILIFSTENWFCGNFTVLYTQCHCTLNDIVHSMPLHTQCHCTLNAIVHSMPLYTQCHCTLNAIVHSMPLYTRTQFSAEKYGISPSLMIRRTFKRVSLYIKHPLL